MARTTRARGGASRGLGPFSLGGEGPGGPPPCQPAPPFPLPWASGFKSGGVQLPSGAQSRAGPGQGRPCSPERSRACQWSLPPRSGLPRIPQSALSGFLCPPGYRPALQSFFFFLIEQIFIEHLLQAVPTLLPPWPLTWANSSSKSHLSGKAPLTPLPLFPGSPPPPTRRIGQGVPLSLSVPPW